MIEAHDLTMKYGELFAVKALELDLQKGDVFGFIGPNGAGKTTTMRILATLLEAHLGRGLRLRLLDLHPPQGNPPPGRLHARLLRRLRRHEGDRVPRVLRRRLSHQGRRPAARSATKCSTWSTWATSARRCVTSLSRGMTQRLGLARVLLHDPQVLLLDEPASGLDPRARIEIRGLLKELRKLGKTIMVSSHILPELADICNKIGIIERGELLVNADVDGGDEAGPPADDLERRRQPAIATRPPSCWTEHAERRESRAARRRCSSSRSTEARTTTAELASAAGRRRLQADAVQGRRDEPGNGVHGADQGDHVVGCALVVVRPSDSVVQVPLLACPAVQKHGWTSHPRHPHHSPITLTNTRLARRPSNSP